MKRFIAFLLVVLVLVTSCSTFAAPPAQQLETFNLAEMLQRTTVALVHRDDEGYLRAHCAGVWINTNIILTAAHCVDNDTNVVVGDKVEYLVYEDVGDLVELNNVKSRSGVVIKFNKEIDLAMIGTINTPKHFITLRGQRRIRVGEHVNVVGQTAGLWFSFSEGVVGHLPRTMIGANDKMNVYLQVSAPVWFGNSGGAVWDDNGNLLGIASFITRAPNMAFFVDRSIIEKFILN